MVQADWLFRWVGKMEEARNRIWAELKSIANHRVPSLGTFYTRTKE